MAHLTTSVEYGTHSLLWLVDSGGAPVSARDLAEFQGIPQAFLAKILSKLEKAGLVNAAEGVRGGYVLAREPGDINFLQIVDAIEGKKPLFDCQDIRNRCVLFGETPPRWATKGVCSIHAVMLRAEKAMRDTLASTSLADVARSVERKAPQEFAGEVQDWLATRVSSRGGKARPPETMLDGRADPAPGSAVPTARRTLINSNPEP